MSTCKLSTRTESDVREIIESTLELNLTKLHTAFANTVNQTGMWDGKAAEWSHSTDSHFGDIYEMIMPMTYGILTVYIRPNAIMVMYSLAEFGAYNQPLYRNRIERSFSYNDSFTEKKIINTFNKKVDGLIQAVATWSTDAAALLAPTDPYGHYSVSDNHILKQIEQLRLHLQHRIQSANLNQAAIDPVFPALMEQISSFERNIIDTRSTRIKTMSNFWQPILYL